MKVTGQSVLTPRSKTMTGIASHAASTAGVSAAVVFGDTIMMSQLPEATRSLMSPICLSSDPSASTWTNSPISECSSTSACMLVQPTTRQGLFTPAFEKQTV